MNTVFTPEFQSTFTLEPAVAGWGLATILAVWAVGLICFAVWLMALIASARREQWVWFVLTLVFGIVAVIYFMVGYAPMPKAQRRGGGRVGGSRRTGRRAAS